MRTPKLDWLLQLNPIDIPRDSKFLLKTTSHSKSSCSQQPDGWLSMCIKTKMIKAVKPRWIFHTHMPLTIVSWCDQNDWTDSLKDAPLSVVFVSPAVPSSSSGPGFAKFCTAASVEAPWIYAPTCTCKSRQPWGWGKQRMQRSGIGCRLQCSLDQMLWVKRRWELQYIRIRGNRKLCKSP